MPLLDLRPGLRTFLLADASISAAVGGSRIFPMVLPQDILEPSLVYNRISGAGDHHMEGSSGLNHPRYQIDSYALSIDTAESLANLVKFRLDGFRGLMGSVVVQGVFFDTERDDYFDDSKLFRVSRDYLIWFEEIA